MEELELAAQKYAEVQKCLDINKSLPWQLSIDTLKLAWLQLDTDQTQHFLDLYLFKIISLMSSQSMSKLGVFERTVMEESIMITMNILIKILPQKPSQIHTLTRILDSTIPFYNGSKTGYTFTPGFPSVRLHAIKRFMDGKGFNILLDIFRDSQFIWPGGEAMVILLKVFNMNEILLGLEEEVKTSFIGTLQEILLKLPDELLKRENTENLNHLTNAILWSYKHLISITNSSSSNATSNSTTSSSLQQQYTQAYRRFWFQFTLKLMNSGSLVLKLFAWEQLNELVFEAKSTRPVAASYIVSGAGSDFINGTYTIVPKTTPTTTTTTSTTDDVFSYTKPGNIAYNIPLLTLFRCTMRTKAKWWFISQADLEKPGTDKDIDYYLHKSSLEEEREPPTHGWTRINTNITLLGEDPPPVVKRGELLLNNNMTRESYFDYQLLELCTENQLLSTLFGSSIHREIISRSGKLLLFLAEYDYISKNNIEMIWKSAIQNNEIDIVDEIFTILVLVSSYLNDELFSFLMNLAMKTLETQPEYYQRIALFLEKFMVDSFRPVNSLPTTTAAMSLLSLVWEFYRDPHFETLKTGPMIQELLSHCLNQRSGAEMVIERILDCKNTLSAYCNTDSPTTVNEDSASRVIRSLYFLISKHLTPPVVEQLDKQDLTTSLVVEIQRYATTNGKRYHSGALDQATYTTQLSDRLDILRKFYSTHPSLTMKLSTMESLSALLSSSSVELEVFLSFVKSCSKAVVSIKDALLVFTRLICSDDIDWSKCGDEAFECFRTYYCELEGTFDDFPIGTELPPRLGLDTLWRIALNVGTISATNAAINLLLQSYDTILFLDHDAYTDMLKIIFSHLENVIANTSTDGLSPHSLLLVARCVSILSAALAKSKGQADVPHAVRGNMHRMHISVCYRRISTHYNPATQNDVVRVEKGSEGVLHLEIHPQHTIKDLKDHIIELAELGSVTITLDHPDRELFTNATRLSELGLIDGGELFVTYQSSFTGKSYEDELYCDASSLDLGASKVVHVGQVLASDYSMFDSLLTLCEMCKDPIITRNIWNLIMQIPTQVDLMQQSVDQICFPSDGNDSSAISTSSDWNKILQNSSEARTAYLLQIIDNVLQPAPETITPAVIARSLQFRDAFYETNGFTTVLSILINTPADDSIVNSTTLSVALHIVHYFLFEVDPVQQSLNTTTTMVDLEEESSLNVSNEKVLHQPDYACHSVALLEQLETSSAQVIEKLLYVASNGASQQASQVVENALMVITKLIKSPEAALQLTSNPQSEGLLTTVLRSDSKKVREMAAEFAVKVGSNQAIVFDWLLTQLQLMIPSDINCTEIFTALITLFTGLHSVTGTTIQETTKINATTKLSQILSDKLIEYPRKKNPNQEQRQVLLGYLETLNVLIGLQPNAVKKTPLGSNLVQSFMSEFLFAVPTPEQDDISPICDNTLTRQAAFSVLSSFLAISQEGFETVLSEMNILSKLAARHMQGNWGLQVSHDVKKADMQFTGLKNQGCTCYMNSLLQVLFMSSAFREAILATPLKEIHRTTLWHKQDEELVGNTYLFEWCNGAWRPGLVIGYDPITALHRIQYMKNDGSSEDIVHLHIHEGRNQRETGRIRVIPTENEEPLSEREESAYRVLDQLQRAFCFMKLSKKRYFDPIHFVESCKSLNLNFNVFHQNDAAEFCDQLLDRIETSTKGKHTKKDIWNDIFLKNVFGGNWLYQKIPRDCEIYNTKKEGCGHWQSSRLESFLKVELMIRGKERIEDSLAELMQGELMDGDNKISCEVCVQKKATVRRTCFGDLPSTLMLHLKRFDLDFQTFETVKLNNRMAFPAKINMLQYTKEGIEAEERRRTAEQETATEEGDELRTGRDNRSPSLQYEADVAVLDPSDYEYELQGVLVHAGVAQGGHYYSFIRDDATEDQWYKFDDDDVTPFSQDQIPTQCFGGPPSANHSSMVGSSTLMDEDRTANALMLLYNKVKKPETKIAASSPDKSKDVALSTPDSSKTSSSSSSFSSMPESEAVLVNGTQAYIREVRESNMQHLLTCYLLDPDLHAFVRGLLSSITDTVNAAATETSTGDTSQSDSADALNASISKLNINAMTWSPLDSVDDLPLRTVQFNCNFLLDVVLHCRERAAMSASVKVLKNAFEAFPHTAVWFVMQNLDASRPNNWFTEYILHCSDALARATFVQIVVHAVSVIAPKESTALLQYKSMKIADLKMAVATGSNDTGILVTLLIRLIVDHMLKSVNHVRTADELFVLIRDLASVSCIAKYLLDMGMVSFLCYFVMPEQVPQMIRNLFEKHIPSSRLNSRIEYSFLLQSVFEAMAALLGVPQIRKVALLQERSYWESDLVPEARQALTVIFQESSRAGGMDPNDIAKYFDRVTGGVGPKATPLQVRNILDRFHTHTDGRLSLEGFLQYHTDLASYNPKNVWRDLHNFGFKNNLSRVTSSGATTTTASAPPLPTTTGTATEDEGNSAHPGPTSPITDGSSDTTLASLEPLRLNENCRVCLSQLLFYECGMTASEASTKAIAKRVCYSDIDMSASLIHQALSKLLIISCENSWNNHPLGVIMDFLRLILSVEDGLQRDRLYEILMHPKHGLAVVSCHEKIRPSNCRANEYNKSFLLNRYVSFIQELLQLPGLLEDISAIAETEPKVKIVRGYLRVSTAHQLTINEADIISNTIVRVEHAGVSEVNGDYLFSAVRFNAGSYARRGTYRGNEAIYTLYKCSLKNGGYQWFLSITPEGMDPGTTNDIDFYYASAKNSDKLPPGFWMRMNPDPQQHSRDPAPSVNCILPDEQEDNGTAATTGHARTGNAVAGDSSDSDRDSFMMVGDDGDGVDDSFASSTEPASRDYYD